MHGPLGEEKRRQNERLRGFNTSTRLKVVVMGGKGGVGKSTVAVNLAVALAQRGLRVGLLDADLHGPNTAQLLGLSGARLEPGSEEGMMRPFPARPNLALASLALTHAEDTPFVWRGPLKITVIRQLLADVEWGQLDVLVADAPPGTGDEPLTLAQSLSGNRLALVVTTPQEVALQDAARNLNFARAARLPLLGVVENMSAYLAADGSELPLFGGPGAEALARAHGTRVLVRLPLDPTQANRPGVPFVETEGVLKEKFEPVVRATVEALESVGGQRPYGEE